MRKREKDSVCTHVTLDLRQIFGLETTCLTIKFKNFCSFFLIFKIKTSSHNSNKRNRTIILKTETEDGRRQGETKENTDYLSLKP